MASAADHCSACGALLAAEQRHCLECGVRRGPPRVDFLALLGVAETRGRPDPAPAPEPELEPAAAAGGIARLRGTFSPAALGTAALALILAGVAIGVAGGPPTPDSLAATARRIVVMTSPTGPVGNPLLADSSKSGDTGGGASTSADTGTAGTSTPSGGGASAASAPASSPSNGTAGLDSTPVDSTPVDTGTGTGTRSPGTTTPPAAKQSSVGHVFVVMLAGRGQAATFGSSAPAGYLRDLPKQGALLTAYRAISAAPTADRVALVSGQAPNPQTEADCPTFTELAGGQGCLYPADTKTVADQLGTVGYQWRAYFGGLDTPCRHPAAGAADDTASSGPHAVAHDPFVHFHAIVDRADCATAVVPLDRLTTDLKAARSTPRLTFMAPDRCAGGFQAPCADGSPGGAAAVDAFLGRWVPAILRSPAYKSDGLLVVTFDRGPDSGPVGAVVLSPFAKAGTRSAKPYDHYALLRTIEDDLGLGGRLGGAAGAGVRAFGTDVFDRKIVPLPAPDATQALAKGSHR